MVRDLGELDATDVVAALKDGSITPAAYAEALAERTCRALVLPDELI